MQITSATLLAAQAQSARPRAAAPFEPMAFKTAAPGAAPSKAAEPSPAASLLTNSVAATNDAPAAGYVRPGTNLDIKI